MSVKSSHLRSLVPAGFTTWAMVGVPEFVSLVSSGSVATAAGMAWLASFFGFGAAFWVATRDWGSGPAELVLIGVQSLLALACTALQPGGFQPVLLVIVAVQLGWLPVLPAVSWIVVQSIVLSVALIASGARLPVRMTLAYLGFQLFGIFVTRIAHQEYVARQALAEANAELRVTTGLLEISSRTEERLRVARDVHDLLGHHLTALSLNLEVASHLATGAVRDHIQKSHALARLLLADLREVVGTLREREPVDLRRALASLRESIHAPSLEIEGDTALAPDPPTAQTLLRVIQEVVTNSIRHSGARHLRLSFSQDGNWIRLVARDDGAGSDNVVFGSGLKGMRERVEDSGGELEVASAAGRGFEVRLALPVSGSPS